MPSPAWVRRLVLSVDDGSSSRRLASVAPPSPNAPSQGRATPSAIFALTLNFMLGAGVLGIPYSFAHAGVAASAACLTAVSLVSILTCSWMIEICERANALRIAYEHHLATERRDNAPMPHQEEEALKPRAARAALVPAEAAVSSQTPAMMRPPRARAMREPLLQPEDAEATVPIPPQQPQPTTTTLGSRLTDDDDAERSKSPSVRLANWLRQPTPQRSGSRLGPNYAPAEPPPPDWRAPRDASALEVSQLCAIFLGRGAQRGWLVAVGALHMTAMWVCASVWVTCAAVAVAYLRGLASGVKADPHALQLPCLLGFAALMLPMCMRKPGSQVRLQLVLAALTLLTITIMIITVGVALIEEDTSGAPPAPLPYHLAVFDFEGFGRCFATLVFSSIVQQAVPALAHDAKYPRRTMGVIGAAMATTCALYLTLGCLAALFFRGKTDPVITLNWLGYTAEAQVAPLWAELVGHWVVLLPMLTTTAAFPLFNATLASNLEEVLPEGPLRRRAVAGPLCAIVPFACTALVRDTAMIFSLAGLSGFVMVFFMPAALQIASTDTCMARWGERGRRTPSASPFSGRAFPAAVLLLGVLMFGFSVWRIALSLADGTPPASNMTAAW